MLPWDRLQVEGPHTQVQNTQYTAFKHTIPRYKTHNTQVLNTEHLPIYLQQTSPCCLCLRIQYFPFPISTPIIIMVNYLLLFQPILTSDWEDFSQLDNVLNSPRVLSATSPEIFEHWITYIVIFYNIRNILLNIHTHCHNTIQLFTKSWDISLLHGWWPSTGPVVLVNLLQAASSLGSLWWQQPKNTHISLQYLLISQSPKGYNA